MFASQQGNLEQKKEEFCRRNEEASSDRCLAVLMELSEELDDKINEGSYSVPGGYQLFQDDRKDMVEKYRLVPGKGIKAEAVLQEFLKNKESVGNSILQMDKSLTEKEKEMEAQRARAEAAEREQKVLAQKQAELEQLVEDQKRSYEENLRQLGEKMEDDREKLLEEQNRILDQKLKEQADLLREGFQKQANQLQEEIRQLREQNEKIKKPSWISTALGTLVDVASCVLPGIVGRPLAAASNFIRRLF
uniref:Guanylate-binding protein/Atlastin C-terminal domain-containing protein n=1 Tax=Sphenodon punctatus TaxID=8508 RepID=A0A8D0HIR3_SPHPU